MREGVPQRASEAAAWRADRIFVTRLLKSASAVLGSNSPLISVASVLRSGRPSEAPLTRLSTASVAAAGAGAPMSVAMDCSARMMFSMPPKPTLGPLSSPPEGIKRAGIALDRIAIEVCAQDGGEPVGQVVGEPGEVPSDQVALQTLHAYFIDRLVPVCGQLLEATAARRDPTRPGCLRTAPRCRESLRWDGQRRSLPPRHLVELLIAGLRIE